MSEDRHRFKLGGLECLAIKDGEQEGETSRLFSNVDPAIYQAALKARGEDPEKIRLSFNVLAVFSDDWVLIDTGTGSLNKESGDLLEILEDEEIRPEHIIITHAHADHYGGLLDKNGEENFPHTPIYMCQDEWMVYTAKEYVETNLQRAETIRKYLLPAESHIERVECKGEILPSFSIMELAGHTAHHVGIAIESRREKLLFVGDAFIHPLHLENLHWQFGNDEDHDTARESRIELAEWAIRHNAIVMAYHLPFPGLGRIERNGEDSYKWIPLELED